MDVTPRNGSRFFTDLGRIYHHHPLQAYTGDAISSNGPRMDFDSILNEPGCRRVQFTDLGGVRRILHLAFFRMPTGASDITLGTKTLSTSTRTYTYSRAFQARFILKTGALAGAKAAADDIAGLLFDDYYSAITDNLSNQEFHRKTALSAGDGFWVIRGGNPDAWVDATIADNVNLVTQTSGRVQAAAAYGTGSVAALGGYLTENVPARSHSYIGRTRAGRTDAGLVEIDLDLPYQPIW
jgi:hypothetical protein